MSPSHFKWRVALEAGISLLVSSIIYEWLSAKALSLDLEIAVFFEGVGFRFLERFTESPLVTLLDGSRAGRAVSGLVLKRVSGFSLLFGSEASRSIRVQALMVSEQLTGVEKYEV